MKKIITTITIFVAVVFCAQGQTTTNFLAGSVNTTFTNLGFNTFTGNLPEGENYTQARLIFSVSGFNFPAAPDPEDPGGTITLTGITLSGQGIVGTNTFANVTIAGNTVDPGNTLNWSATVPSYIFPTPFQTWDSSGNIARFRLTYERGASASVGAQISYAVQYANTNGAQLNTAFGSVGIVAVPEPSTYFAAAGLLGLCLWSARRHLFNFAEARSTSSGDSPNGAA